MSNKLKITLYTTVAVCLVVVAVLYKENVDSKNSLDRAGKVAIDTEKHKVPAEEIATPESSTEPVSGAVEEVKMTEDIKVEQKVKK